MKFKTILKSMALIFVSSYLASTAIDYINAAYTLGSFRGLVSAIVFLYASYRVLLKMFGLFLSEAIEKYGEGDQQKH